MTSNAFATPQLFVTGRLVNAIGFDTEEIYIKYKIIIGDNFTLLNGVLSGETFQAISNEEEGTNTINFDQPLNFNLKCDGIEGWPKIIFEVFSNDRDGRNCLIGYGTGYFPVKAGSSRLTINCWRPSDSTKSSLSETFLGNNNEFLDISAVYTTLEKFGLNTISTSQINIEVDMIFKDFILHGIDIN